MSYYTQLTRMGYSPKSKPGIVYPQRISFTFLVDDESHYEDLPSAIEAAFRVVGQIRFHGAGMFARPLRVQSHSLFDKCMKTEDSEFYYYWKDRVDILSGAYKVCSTAILGTTGRRERHAKTQALAGG